MKIIKYGILLLTALLFTACNGIKPEIMQKNVSVDLPTNKLEKHPFVIFFQGTGGNNSRADKWAEWFAKYGVAAVKINSAGARNLQNLRGVHDMNMDLSPTLEVLKDNSNLDLSHYAVMGFSRGGTAALKSATSLKDNQVKPDFVFSLYPGLPQNCPNTHNNKTQVHVFYGELDNWGNYKGIRNSCKTMTTWYDNAFFHLLKNAHHGYDGDWDGTWSSNRNTFTSKPNEEALTETKQIILKAIKDKWNIK